MVKNLPANTRNAKRHRLDFWVGKMLWSRKWQPSLIFLPGKLHGQRSLACYSAWGCKELDMTERLGAARPTHTHTDTHTENGLNVKSNFLKTEWESKTISMQEWEWVKQRARWREQESQRQRQKDPPENPSEYNEHRKTTLRETI